MERNIILFDTETTGLGDRDEVIQFSAVVLHQKDGHLSFKDVISFYCDTNVFINPDASAIHGITNDRLKELSGGKFFEEQIIKYPDIINPQIPTIFVAYNIAFDKRLVNQTLLQNGYGAIDFGKNITSMPRSNVGTHNLCLMKYCEQMYTGGRRIKLQTVIDKYVKTNLLDSLYVKLKDTFNITDTATSGYHDALYDTIACTVIFVHNRLHLAY